MPVLALTCRMFDGQQQLQQRQRCCHLSKGAEQGWGGAKALWLTAVKPALLHAHTRLLMPSASRQQTLKDEHTRRAQALVNHVCDTVMNQLQPSEAVIGHALQ